MYYTIISYYNVLQSYCVSSIYSIKINVNLIIYRYSNKINEPLKSQREYTLYCFLIFEIVYFNNWEIYNNVAIYFYSSTVHYFYFQHDETNNHS